MPIDKQKGPGGVAASYGARSTKVVFDTSKTYDNIVADSDGNILSTSGLLVSEDKDKVVPDPLWVSGEAVVVSDVRRLPTGERLICVVAGTTGTTAPTIAHGSAPGAITDNTATWWALDIYENTFVDQSGATALPSIFNFHNNPEYFFNGSAPNRVTFAGSGIGTRSNLWAVVDGSSNDGGFGANGRIGKYATREFDTDSDYFEIGYFATIAGAVRERIQVRVNNKLIFDSPFKPGAIGSSRNVRINLGKGVGWKNVVVSGSGLMALQYISIPSYASIRYPAAPGSVLGMWTDSFGDTESPALISPEDDFTPTVAKTLGFKHVVMAGVGGTSYSVDNSGRKNLNELLDLNDLKGLNMDAIVIGHGYNAGQAGTTALTEANAAKSSWAKLRLACPGAPMVIIGSWYQNPTNSAGHASVETALKNSFLERKDYNSVFIDPFDGSITTGRGKVVQEATGPWLSASVASWAIPAAGGVFDGAHPSPAGRVFLTGKTSTEVKKAFAALGKSYS